MNKVVKKISDTILTLFDSLFHRPDQSFEEERKKTVFALFLLFGISTLISFGIFHFSRGSFTRSLLLFLVVALLTASLISLRYLKRALPVFRMATFILGCYFLSTMIIGGAQGARILWLLLFPPIAFFLLGKKEGLLWSAIAFFLSLFSLIDPDSIIGTFPYETEIRIRFLIAYGLLALMAYIVESTRQRYQEGMENEQLKLQTELAERMRAEEELEKHRHHLEELVEERASELVVANEKLIQKIKERKLAEQALRESEEKYRILVENANDAIFVAQDEVIKFPNPKTENISGYSEEELFKISFADLIHPEDKDMVLDRHRKRLAGGELSSTYSFRIINKTGEELWMQLSTVFINWEGRPATLNFLRDITLQRKLEAQFQYAQRMEAIGTLAGGIAHDFNNLLMGIQGNASLMLLDVVTSHPQYEKLKNIEQYVRNGADLTKQLLGFARGGKYEVKPTDLNDLVKKSSEMFGRTKKEITIHPKYQEGIWTVEVDQGQIEQVLLNLYVNAWQAMPGGGELHLQTENVTLDEDFAKPFAIEGGKYVKTSVTDTGAGMDDATQQRIFDPFFTTKEMGRGTGLGLASAYGIIKNHGGFINVYSEKGEGTTFNIYLPASEKKVIEDKMLSEEVLKGTETVLLVDDEEMITDVGGQFLQRIGYRVLIARNGKEAIEIYEKSKDQIDLVILDMIMPVMGGGETYDRLKEIDPEIKVLLSSGYSIDGEATEILGRGCNGFIQKPFDVKKLSQKTRGILGKD